MEKMKFMKRNIEEYINLPVNKAAELLADDYIKCIKLINQEYADKYDKEITVNPEELRERLIKRFKDQLK